MTMAQAQPLDISTPAQLTSRGAPKGSLWTGLLQVLSNRYERKSAATVALVFFVGLSLSRRRLHGIRRS